MKSPTPDCDFTTYCLHNVKNKVSEPKNFIAISFNQRDI